jgi:hypothetical protein
VKRIKDAIHFLGWNALAAVLDRDFHIDDADRLWLGANCHSNDTTIRVLHGVADQVHQDLA